MVSPGPDREVAAIASLDDPTRRRLYDHVASRPVPVTRDQVSAALGVDRSVVAYHLDKLADEGLLAVSFARPPGRAGPGAGRPAKHYARADDEFAVTLPPRDYLLVAELLARAAASDPSGTVRRAVAAAAADLGQELGEASAPSELDEVLTRQGYEPYDDGGTCRLRNCPFHRLAAAHTDLVCGMNLAMLSALADALGAPGEAVLDPAPDRCCVAFEPEER